MPGQDTRVVEMQFNNSQFERNIAKSKRSLADFKEELNFESTSQGMTKFAKAANALNLDGLANNIQKLADKFTGLGNAGEYVLSRIRNGLESTAMRMESFIKSFTTEQIRVGQSKYEEMNKAALTIMNSINKSTGTNYTAEETYEVMQRLMDYTDQTSASFQNMVNNISNFTSAGQSLQSSEDAMEGIFNMTMKMGQGVTESNYAMQAFSKALGQGFLGKNQWDTLNLSAHVTGEEFRKTLMETAVEVGTLTKESDKYYTNTKKGKKTLVEVGNLEAALNTQFATTEVIMKTLQKYHFDKLTGASEEELNTFAGAAYKSAQRALNFRDAMNAVKESVSSGWMQTFSYLFGQVNDAMAFFTPLCEGIIDVLGRLGTVRNKILENWADLGGRKSFFSAILGSYAEDAEEGAYGLLDALNSIADVIGEAFWNVVRIFVPDDQKGIFDENFKNFREYFLGKKLQELTDAIRGSIAGIKDFLNEEINIGGESKSRLAVIQDIVNGIASAFLLAWRTISAVVGFFQGLKQKLNPSFHAVEGSMSKLGQAIYDLATGEVKNNTIENFFDGLLESMTPLTDGINNLVVNITGLINAMIELARTEEAKTFFKAVGDGIKGFFRTISAVAGPVLGFFGDLIGILTDLIEGNFSEGALTKAGEDVGAAFGAMLDKIVESLPDGIKEFWGKIKELFSGENIPDGKESPFAKLVEWFKGMDLSKLLSLAGSGAGLAAFVGLFMLVKKVHSAVHGVLDFLSDIPESIGKIFEKWKKIQSKADLKLQFAGATVMIAAIGYLIHGLVDLAKLETGWTGIGQMLTGLFGTLTLIAGYMFAISRLGIDKIKAVGVAGLAYGLGVLVKAIEPFANVNWDQYGRMMAGLAGVLAQLVGVMWILSHVKIAMGFQQLTSFIGFVLSIAILVQALTPFTYVSWENYGKMMAGLAGVLLELVGFMLLMKTLKLAADVDLVNFIGFASSIAILILSLQAFSYVSWENLGKMMAGLGGILLELVGFMLLMKTLKLAANVDLVNFISFAASIGLLVMALQTFTYISWESYGKMMAGLAGILLELVGFMMLIRATNVSVMSLDFAGLMGFVLSISVLIMALQAFTYISWESYGKMMAGLAGILLEIIGFMALIRATNVSIMSLDFAGLMGFVLSLSVLILSLTPLTYVSWENLGKMMAGLTTVMLLLLGFSKLAAGLTVNLSSVAGILGFAVAISAIMLAFSVALTLVGGMDIGVIIAFAASLSVLVVAMAVAFSVASSVPIAAGIKGILLLSAGIVAIGLALAAVIPIIMGALGDSLVNLGGKIRLAGSLFSQFVGIMGNVGDSEIDDTQNKFEKIKSILSGLSGFGGMDVDAEAFQTAMFALGAGVESFYVSAKRIGNVDNLSALQLLKDIQQNYEGIDALSKMSLGNLEANISGLGGAMMLYAMGAKEVKEASGEAGEGVDEQAITAAVKIMQKIAETLVEDGEFTIPTMPSETDMTAWGTKLASLAGALIKFEQAGAGLGNGTTKALATLDFFKQLKIKLEDIQTNGYLAWVAEFMNVQSAESENVVNGGDVSPVKETVDVLTKFGSEISGLGTAIANFVDITTDLDQTTGERKPKNWQPAIDALNEFEKLQEKMPKVDNSVWGWIVGYKKDLGQFGLEIESLGLSLVAFSNQVTGNYEGGKPFDSTATTAALSAADAMVTFMEEMQTRLPKMGGIAQLFDSWWNGGTMGIDKLGDYIGQLGDGLGKLGTGLNAGKWTEAAPAQTALGVVNQILDIAKTLGQLQGMDAVVGTPETWMDNLTYVLDSLTGGWMFRTGSKAGMTTTSSAIDGIVTFMNQLTMAMEDVAEVDMNKLNAAQMIASIINDLTNVNITNDFSVVGANMAAGIAAGIQSGTAGVINAIANLATAAVTYAKSAFAINSPSKVFAEMGAFVSAGLAQGITSGVGMVGRSSSGMASEAIDSAANVISLMGSMLDEDLDSNPTISPVIDLTGFNQGVSAMQRSMSKREMTIDTSAVGRYTLERFPNRTTPEIHQNGTGADYSGLYAKIDQMTAQIQQLGTQMSKMKLVLDSGVVAGGVTDDVDRNIGRRMFYADRNN